MINCLFQIIFIYKTIQIKLFYLFIIQTKKILSLVKKTNNIILTNLFFFNLLILNNIIQKVNTLNIKYIFITNLFLKDIRTLQIKF